MGGGGLRGQVGRRPGPEYADVVFLVDSSDRLGIKSFPFVKSFINKMISSLPIEADKYHVGLAQYSDGLHREFLLRAFKSRAPMLNHIKKNFGFLGGSLRIGNALQEVHRAYFSGGRDKKLFPPILVVLASAESEDAVEEAAEALRKDGVRIVSVGMQGVSEKTLKAMATGQFHYSLRTARDLSTFSRNMTQILKDAVQYKDGVAHSDMEVPFPRACEKDSIADLMFLVDEAVGTTENLRLLQNFLKNITSSMDVQNNCLRLGLMSYSDRVKTFSLLNSSTTLSEFQKQIQKLSLEAGKSIAGAALEQMRREGFSASHGSRRAQGVPQIAVLVTNRPSDDNVREVALDLRLQDVTVLAVGIEGANKTQLEEIVSYPPGQTISMLGSYADLHNYSCVDTKEADLYFLIDGSGSIQGKHFEQIKEFMLAVIGMFSIGPDKVRVGAVQYSREKTVEFDINDYLNDVKLRKAVSNIKQLGGGTLTGAALDFMLPLVKKGRKQRTNEVPCHLVVLTDGLSEDAVLEPAERLRAENITIHAIGIGEANRTQLTQIAREEERVNFGQNFDALKSIKNEVVRRICTEKGCENMKADIMFLVDSSGSIGRENFEKMKTFMKNLLDKIQIGGDKSRVGVVQFSGVSKEEFQLDKYFTQKEISDAIDSMDPISENTLTGSAITFVDPYFTEAKGGRAMVKKFLILITDGEAQDDVRDPAKALRDKGVVIFSVGVYGANRNQLEEISGDGSLIFHVENFDDLKAIESKLIFRVCALHGSISVQDQENMINLTIHLVKKSDVGLDRVRFGALRYSDDPEVLFYLNKYSSRSAIIEHLRRRRDTAGSTYTAKALERANDLFTEQHGSRLKQNVKQMLIVITDGVSHDRENLSDAASKLRTKGVIIHAVGVGAADQVELEMMAGDKNHTIHVSAFDKLKDIYLPLQDSMCNNAQEVCNVQEADVIFFCDGSDMVSDSDFVTMTTFLSDLIDNFDIQSQRMKIGMAQFGSRYEEIIELQNSLTKTEWKSRIQSISKSKGLPRIDLALRKVSLMFEPSAGGRRNADCFLDIVVGFDISTHLRGQPLFHGHPRLESYLPGILEDITSIRGVSCGAGAEVQVSMAFKVNSDQNVPAKFQIYQQTIFDRLLQVTVNGPTHLNAQFLQSMWDTFENVSTSQGQVLLIFSDGLGGESKLMLEDQSDRLREAGLDALLVVSLNATTHDEFSSFEFGKGFDYRTHLTIGMKELGREHCREDLLLDLEEKLDPKETEGVQDVQGSGVKRENTEMMGLMDWMGKRAFMDFLGKREKKGSPGSRGPPGGYGEKGFPGDPGNPGQSSNIKGQKGSKGEQGRQGRTGQKGTPGSPSSKGSRGRQGHRGAQGALGEPGTPGPQGESGAEGLQGSQGLSGPPGKKGEKGDEGQKGPQGAPGPVGDKGSVGRPGLLGKKGEPGIPGDPGPAGQVGQRGKQGDAGDPGIPGGPGPKGFRGLTLTVGLKGEKGSPGRQGPPGRR
ncbi:hypothetical protein Celaphus_00012785, partial [Cervus elaphus hippelaphus]